MLTRVLEPEVMDSADEARDYDQMDHSVVNRAFATDFFSAVPRFQKPVLDVGTGTAQIPIEMCKQSAAIQFIAIDLAESMLQLAKRNVIQAGFPDRIVLEKVNGRELPYPDGHFGSVISNSIIHHIPEPRDCFAEMVRVCQQGGSLFIRDLFRPDSEAELQQLVKTYTQGANDHQRLLFANSLRAGLTVAEVRSLVSVFGFTAETVRPTSDRHWTFIATKSK